MKKRLLLAVVFILLFSFSAWAQENGCLYYFYGEGCPNCGATGPYLEQLQSNHPNLEIHNFEVYYNKTNLKLMQDYFDAYQVPLEKQEVPVVFLSNSYFVGKKPIIEYLESALLSNQDSSCSFPEKNETLGVVGEGSPKHLIETLTFGVITGAALVDSFNPCAIAVLLILLGILLAKKEKRKLFRTGFAFIFAIYLAYFLFGLGLISVLALTGVSYYFYKIIGILAVLIGLFNIYGKIFLTKIPHKWRFKLNKLLRKVTSPAGAFIIGFAVCLFELPCTGGPYSVIIGLLAEKVTRWAAMPLLLYYNLIFVLPLIIITLIIHFALKKIEEHKSDKIDIHGEIEKWRQRNTRLLHLVAGIIMFLLGILILFFF